MLCSVAPPRGENKNEDNVPIVRRSNKVYRDPCEQETTEWVEREVMARVLSEMYPKKGWQREKEVGKERRRARGEKFKKEVKKRISRKTGYCILFLEYTFEVGF